MANMPSLKYGKYAIFCVLNKSEASCNKMGIKRWSGLKAYLKLNLFINYFLLLAKQ
jgi:hypothetical protein